MGHIDFDERPVLIICSESCRRSVSGIDTGLFLTHVTAINRFFRTGQPVPHVHAAMITATFTATNEGCAAGILSL
jgi:hypothetical protein